MGQWSWLCARGSESAAILERLQLAETGDLDFDGSAYASYAELPSSWIGLIALRFDLFTPESAGLISAQGEAVGGHAWETVTLSSAWGYRAGQQVWSVTHDPNVEPRSLETAGIPPTELSAIRDRLIREQDKADQQDVQVDHIFEVALELSGAVCGFRPDQLVVPPGTVFKELEPLRSGKGRVAQDRQRALGVLLTAKIRESVFSFAQSLGFRPVLEEPDFHRFYHQGATNAFVRRRAERSESLEFKWGFYDGLPQIAVNFFVRKGSEPRFGRSGTAADRPRPLSMIERFTGRKGEPVDAIAKVVETGRMLLVEIDAHLNDGSAQPHIRPAEYRDQG